jgi:hypothetical protein
LKGFFYLNVLWKRPDKVFGNKADGFDAAHCQIVIPPQKKTFNACELLKVQQPLGFALLDAER